MSRTYYTFDTEYSADSCESCRRPGLEHVLATGTYQVNKIDPESESPTTERLGRIYIHHVNISESSRLKNGADPCDGGGATSGEETERCSARSAETPGGKSRNVDCRLAEKVENAAVLDMKWNAERLAVATATGHLQIYSYSEEEGENRLTLESETSITSGLALALEWSSDSERVAVSDSCGRITVLTQSEGTGLEVERQLVGHAYEAWTTCFSAHQDCVLYSGGDDNSFNCYDLRVGGDRPVLKNSQEHSMGVTAMLSSRFTQHHLFTGSYDETLRLWDERSLKSCVGSCPVGGGIWRIKQRQDALLVAAMHAGFLILDRAETVLLSGGLLTPPLVRYTEHESLAYGADWLGQEGLLATCSFYDHSLRIWSC